MGDDPLDVFTHDERSELGGLRRRAYGPDADILDDPSAAARLSALEERLRRARSPREDPPTPAQTIVREPAAAAPVPRAADIRSDPRTPSRRRRAAPVAAVAVVAVLWGGAAWSERRGPASAAPAADTATTPVMESERRSIGYMAGYSVYLEGLREAVLELPGSEQVADRMIEAELRPYGILYGRTVGVGPTVDDEFCMIIADLPESSVTCIPIAEADANPVSVVLASWYTDADSDLFTGLGEPVSFTLMPGGSVVAELADPVGSTDRGAAPAPTPTATPPPGWQ